MQNEDYLPDPDATRDASDGTFYRERAAYVPVRRPRPVNQPARNGGGNGTMAWVLGAVALGAAVGAQYALYRQITDPRPRGAHDSAPGRTARRRRFGDYAVVGRTVTINKPRSELYAYWRDFPNLATFMQSVEKVEMSGSDLSRWTIAAPMGQKVKVVTRVVADRPDEMIAWRSTEASDIDTEGRVSFRDAPGERGTEVEAIIAYKPPAGELGRMIAKLYQREPGLQGRRELKRFKMLMETGEIATSRNRRPADGSV